jgi:hypothetical protein
MKQMENVKSKSIDVMSHCYVNKSACILKATITSPLRDDTKEELRELLIVSLLPYIRHLIGHLWC